MRMRLLAGSAVAAITIAISGVALAADMPVAPEPVYTKAPPPLMDWSGFYAGAHVGWGRARFSGVWHDLTTDDEYPWSTRPSGILGGVHVGHNWQVNTFVYGWEADVSGMSWKKTVTGFVNPDDSITTKVSLLASLRGRLGMTLDPQTLVYVTGGLGYAHAKATAFSSSLPATGTAKFKSFGWVVGTGVEWKQNQDWSWRLEGLWYIFNKNKRIVLDPDPDTGQFVDVKFKDAVVIRAGVTRHF